MPKPFGFKVTDETKKKISKSHIGIRPSEETRKKQSLAAMGRKSPMEGKKHTVESRKRMGESRRGSKSRFWKGGISKLSDLIRGCVEYSLWRTAVFQRDNYTCVWCGANKKYLNADHIKQFAVLLIENDITTLEEAIKCEELWMVNNGRTLCIDCHKETDTYLNKGRKLTTKYGIFNH